MAKVILTGGLRRFAQGELEIEIEAANVRDLIRALDARFPGIAAEIEDSMSSISIDGEVVQDPLLEPTPADSEIHFLPPIQGG